MTNRNETEQVLVVEDNQDHAVLIQRWLGDAQGIAVTIVPDGESAVRALMRSTFQVVLSDISLPGMDGLDVARAVRTIQPDAMVALVTAHDEIDYAVQAIRARVDDFVRKPLNRRALVDSIESLLRRARRQSATRRHTVLAVGAHPDDVEIGCGGRLVQHVAAGDRVIILTLTAGEAAGSANARAMESRSSAAMLGVELRLAGLQDTSLSPGAETIRTIEKVVSETAPTLVYTHSRHDTHQDHRASHQATLVAARHVPSVLCYQSPSSTTAFAPTHFDDISDTMNAKLEAVGRYVSQVTKCDYLECDLLRATARYWGRFSRKQYVEPFEVVRSSSPPYRGDGNQVRVLRAVPGGCR